MKYLGGNGIYDNDNKVWNEGNLKVFNTTANGLVPKTTTSNTTDYLRRDGVWAKPPDTVYSLPVANSNSLGGVKSGTDIAVDASGNVSVVNDSHTHDGRYFTETEIQSSTISMRKPYINANGVPSSNLSSPTLAEMALFQEQFNNKTEFYDISLISFQTSTDGVTWSDFAVSDSAKRLFVGGDAGTSIVIPNGTIYFRIKVRAKSYVYLNALYAYFSSSGHSTKVQIYKKHDSGSYTQHTSATTTVRAWPGHLYLPFSSIPFNPSAVLGAHYHEIYVVFIPNWNASHPSNSITLYRFQLWGGYPAGRRTIYSLDEYRNASFPAIVRGTQLASTIATGTSPLTVNSTTKVSNLNADILDDQEGSYYLDWNNFTNKPITFAPPIATSSVLGGVKSGTDITVDASGNVSVNDDSHNHVISNVDGLQTALDNKVDDSQVLTNVPANAVFTDTVYTHPTTAGNKHIPSGGSTGQFLKWSSNGTATWSADNDTKTARFVIGTSSVAGWAAKNCDYLCDGTADDVEINAAIAALPEGGGEIVILDGTYDITAEIVISKDYMNLRGNGVSTILKRGFNSVGHVNVTGVINLSAMFCNVSNLQIDGNVLTHKNFINMSMIINAPYNTVENIASSNSKGSGVYIRGNKNRILNSYFGYNESYGIVSESATRDNIIEGNECSFNGIGIHSSGNCIIRGNICLTNNYYGISIAKNAVVSDNICEGNIHGIYANEGTGRNTITGNSCNDNSRYGCMITTDVDNNVVSSNNFDNNTVGGINLVNSDNNTITGNSCIRDSYTASQYTILLGGGLGSNYNLISSNHCKGKAVVIGGGTSNTDVNNKYS